jgi:hypothetical protein
MVYSAFDGDEGSGVQSMLTVSSDLPRVAVASPTFDAAKNKPVAIDLSNLIPAIFHVGAHPVRRQYGARSTVARGRSEFRPNAHG